MTQSRLDYLLALLVAVLMLIFIGAPQQAWRLWRIQGHTAFVSGTVTQLDCQNHGSLIYRYHVDGVPYAGSATSFDGACRSQRLG